MSKELSDEEILRIWRNPAFEGSYVGPKKLQVLLKTNFDIDVSEKRLYKILEGDSIYLIHKRTQKKFPRRFYDLRYYCEVIQTDLAYMFEYNSYKYFILAVDLFSSKIAAFPLKTKKSEEVAKQLANIFKFYAAPITKLETDRGAEFGSEVKKLLKHENIVHRFKFHPNKASAVEHFIGILKKRIYMRLRGTLSKDWVSALRQVTAQMNNTPLKHLGWLKPSEINSVADSVKVFEAKRKHGIPILHEPSFEVQIKNQQKYEQNAKNLLQKGSYCYLDFDEKLFDKSYDVSVCYFYFK